MPDSEPARRLRAQLVSALADDGRLPSPVWRRAFERVRRELFVPRFWRETDRGWELVDGDRPDHHEDWLEAMYRDEVLFLRPDDDEEPLRRSSSSMPSVMATMLEALAVRDGDAVLEIGTGSGYNAALLCERLGSNRVTTVDCDVELVEAARQRLSEHGYEPTVAAADGFLGHAPTAPYDRVIATCAVRQVPRAWIAQTRPGGRILAMLPHGMAQLTVDADGSAEGRFHPFPFDFMRMQGHWRPQPPDAELLALVDQGAGETTPYGQPALVNERNGQVAYYSLTQLVVFGYRADVEVAASRYLVVDLWDSSWALYDYERETVTQGGPRRLWDTQVALHDAWCSWGRPPRERFGLSVPADGGRQEVWLDDPSSECRWPLAGWEPEPAGIGAETGVRCEEAGVGRARPAEG
jgi:protein-L-isoaspartate O-methyltransferase